MTVKELKEILKHLDDDTIIVTPFDSEGELYQVINDIQLSRYYAVDNWCGELYDFEEISEDDSYDYPCAEDGEDCLVLIP